jgi:hypothetical protein
MLSQATVSHASSPDLKSTGGSAAISGLSGIIKAAGGFQMTKVADEQLDIETLNGGIY